MQETKKVKLYSDEEKIAIIDEYLTGNQTAKSIQKKYGLQGHSQIQDWMIVFGLRGKRLKDAQDSTAEINSQQVNYPTDLEKRVKQLEQELENERLRVVLLDKIIEIAERDLKISIRKKSGAKQSKK